MKEFIDKVFKKRKSDVKQIEETKEILSEQIEASIKEVEKEIQVEVYTKPGHYFADCNCFKCVRWRIQSAK